VGSLDQYQITKIGASKPLATFFFMIMHITPLLIIIILHCATIHEQPTPTSSCEQFMNSQVEYLFNIYFSPLATRSVVKGSKTDTLVLLMPNSKHLVFFDLFLFRFFFFLRD
jgi:hypothetical protein